MQTGKRQLQLGLDSDCPEDRDVRRRVDEMLEQCRLADTRLAADDQRAAIAPTNSLEKPRQESALRRPPAQARRPAVVAPAAVQHNDVASLSRVLGLSARRFHCCGPVHVVTVPDRSGIRPRGDASVDPWVRRVFGSRSRVVLRCKRRALPVCVAGSARQVSRRLRGDRVPGTRDRPPAPAEVDDPLAVHVSCLLVLGEEVNRVTAVGDLPLPVRPLDRSDLRGG